MNSFSFTSRLRICSVAGALAVLCTSISTPAAGDSSLLRSAELPSNPDGVADLPIAPPTTPPLLPLFWNGGFPGIAPSYASGTGGTFTPPTPAARHLAALWSTWLSVGRFAGMSFPEWVMASGGRGAALLRPAVPALPK